jgi:hypothetical protein
MKILTLFDKSGDIVAMLHVPAKSGGPTLQFAPGPGQQMAELEVPEALRSLKPKELHGAIRIESYGAHRMIAR